jgi:hypothetical protein
LNAAVISPTALFRQALTMGTGTLNRRGDEVQRRSWSKTPLSDATGATGPAPSRFRGWLPRSGRLAD